MGEIEKPEEQTKANKSMAIVGINLAILAIYTIILKIVPDGIVIDAMLIFLHLLTCIIMAIALKSWIWFLSSILVLVIGFSTCVSLMQLNLH